MIEAHSTKKITADKIFNLAFEIARASSSDNTLRTVPVTEIDTITIFTAHLAPMSRIGLVCGHRVRGSYYLPFCAVSIRPDTVDQISGTGFLANGILLTIAQAKNEIDQKVITPTQSKGYSFEEYIDMRTGKKKVNLGGLRITDQEVISLPYPDETFANLFIASMGGEAMHEAIMQNILTTLSMSSQTTITEYDALPDFPFKRSYPILPQTRKSNAYTHA